MRTAVAGQLPAIGRAISRELLGGALLDEALELLRDEEAQVGGARGGGGGGARKARASPG